MDARQRRSVSAPGAGDDARRLAGLFERLDQARRSLRQRATLGTADMRLLWLLTDGEPRTLRQISEELHLEQSTVNRQVNAAAQAGLLTRSRAGSSGPFRFSASAGGAREFELNLDETLSAYRAALGGLGPEQDRFLSLMADYVQAYVEHAQGDLPS